MFRKYPYNAPIGSSSTIVRLFHSVLTCRFRINQTSDSRCGTIVSAPFHNFVLLSFSLHFNQFVDSLSQSLRDQPLIKIRPLCLLSHNLHNLKLAFSFIQLYAFSNEISSVRPLTDFSCLGYLLFCEVYSFIF